MDFVVVLKVLLMWIAPTSTTGFLLKSEKKILENLITQYNKLYVTYMFIIIFVILLLILFLLFIIIVYDIIIFIISIF